MLLLEFEVFGPGRDAAIEVVEHDLRAQFLAARTDWRREGPRQVVVRRRGPVLLSELAQVDLRERLQKVVAHSATGLSGRHNLGQLPHGVFGLLLSQIFHQLKRLIERQHPFSVKAN